MEFVERAHLCHEVGWGRESERLCAFWNDPAHPIATRILPSKKHHPLGPTCSPDAVAEDNAPNHKGYKHRLLAAFNPLRIDSDRNTRGNSDRCGVHNRCGRV
jgi:hypothetical protein